MYLCVLEPCFQDSVTTRRWTRPVLVRCQARTVARALTRSVTRLRLGPSSCRTSLPGRDSRLHRNQTQFPRHHRRGSRHRTSWLLSPATSNQCFKSRPKGLISLWEVRSRTKPDHNPIQDLGVALFYVTTRKPCFFSFLLQLIYLVLCFKLKQASTWQKLSPWLLFKYVNLVDLSHR